MTAVREANQVGALQPTTLVCYDADIERVFDTRDADALAAEDMSPALLADHGWRDGMNAAGLSQTQAFSRRLVAKGFQGLLVRSFAPGASADDLNLVLWSWGERAPSRLILIGEERRPSR